MISILCPTRGRPDRFAAMVESARSLAVRPVDVVAYLDDDDPERDQYPAAALGLTRCVGPRQLLAECWNACIHAAAGDILMHAGDDLLFRTPGWDSIVEEEFARWPDRIVLVHGDDGGDHPQEFATHGFLHRRWVDTVGYFTPPYFASDMCDRWLSEVADTIDRRVRVPIVTEHMHPLWGKAEMDDTYRQRMERHAEQRPDVLYDEMAWRRKVDVAKLLDLVGVAA